MARGSDKQQPLRPADTFAGAAGKTENITPPDKGERAIHGEGVRQTTTPPSCGHLPFAGAAGKAENITPLDKGGRGPFMARGFH